MCCEHNVFVVWMNPVLLRRSQIVAASVMSETHHIVAQCMITESIAAEHNIASSKNHTVFFRTPRSMPLHTNHPALHVAALRLLWQWWFDVKMQRRWAPTNAHVCVCVCILAPSTYPYLCHPALIYVWMHNLSNEPIPHNIWPKQEWKIALMIASVCIFWWGRASVGARMAHSFCQSVCHASTYAATAAAALLFNGLHFLQDLIKTQMKSYF